MEYGENRTLREEKPYQNAFGKLGSPKRLDDVLAGLYWSISTNPETWPVVPGFNTIRIAKSDGYGDTPMIRIWFRIESDYEISLLYLEMD